MTVPGSHRVVPHARRPIADAREGGAWTAHVPAIAYARRIDRDAGAAIARTIHVSPQVEQLLGFSAAEMLDDPSLWTSRIHRDDLGRVLATWRRVREPGDRQVLTYRMIARDGHVVRLRDDAVLVEDEVSGSPTWHGVAVDVGADAPTETELREAEAKYRLLVEQIPAVTYIDQVPLDDPTDLTPIYISPQIERLLGYLPEQWLSDPDLWDRVTHPDDREAAEAGARRAFEDGSPFSIEYRMISRDGRTVWVREEASLYRDELGAPKFWQGIYVDITELKRAEEELNRALGRERDASGRLRALDEMKNTFLQAVSHDLRTPLAAILGLALTLERADLHLDASEVHDLATRIASNSRKLDRMVADLLDLDRLSRGIVEPKLRTTELGALVRDLVAAFDMTGGRTVTVTTTPVTLGVDAAKVERIVENLLANVVRHTPADTKVWVEVRPDEGGARITIEDDGPGVPLELHGAVFDPFRQGPSASSHSPGAGIGLALVARFAELHGGRVWLEDRPGGGASFRVFLPAARD